MKSKREIAKKRGWWVELDFDVVVEIPSEPGVPMGDTVDVWIEQAIREKLSRDSFAKRNAAPVKKGREHREEEQDEERYEKHERALEDLVLQINSLAHCMRNLLLDCEALEKDAERARALFHHLRQEEGKGRPGAC